jgi:hypothetical protein
MKPGLPGNFIPSPLKWCMCFALFLTASGCASTNIPINPSDTTDAVSHVSVSKEDHVLVYTKDDRTLDMVITEINSERQIIIGRPISKPKDSYYKPIAVSYSDIASIEIKKHPSTKNGQCISTTCEVAVGTLQTIVYFGFYPLLFGL